MSDSRLSVETLVTEWVLSHNKRFEFETRMQSCIELFELLIGAGYEPDDIGTRVKTLALSRMVGHKSKFGKKGLDRWRAAAEQDYNDAFNTFFRPTNGKAAVTEFAAEPVEEAQPVAFKEAPAPQPKVETQTASSDDSDIEGEGDWRAKFREGVTTTPPEDEADFMARMGLK